jgi:hypothetical protein
MQTVQGIMSGVLRAVQQFLDKYTDRLGDVVKSGSRRQLDQAMADLENLASSQASSLSAGKGGTQKAKVLRTELVKKHIVPIARIAAVNIPVTPELAAKFTLPKGNPTAEKLVSFAHGMATSAEPFAATFIAAGMPADFIAQLRAATDAVADYGAKRKGNTSVGEAATKGIRQSLAAGTRVLGAIDGLVVKALDAGVASDAVILAEWAAVKKVRKMAVRPIIPPAPIPIPPAPALIALAPISSAPATPSTPTGGA